MPRFVCHLCGTQHADSESSPPRCIICSDDRQYVEWTGQCWTTVEELASTRQVRIEADGDLLGIGVEPAMPIPQRALLATTDAGNILWDCIAVITPDSVGDLSDHQVAAIAISHPHFYTAMVEWSHALGGVPILLHESDREWVQRPDPHIEYWSGDRLELGPATSLVHCPGHFPGSAVLHWRDEGRGRHVVLAGDSLHVCGDRRHVSFVHSVPNNLPMHPDLVEDLRRRLLDLPIDDIYGFTWGLNIIGDGRRALDASFDRYFQAVGRG